MADDCIAPGDERPIESIERELTTLAGHINAANYRFLVLLGEFDARHGYAGVGIASCAHWLSWRCGVGLVAAREKVRVARALRGLPLVSDAMRRGVLSYCKVRALTRAATAETEARWLAIAEAGTVSHVEKTLRLVRRVQRAEELEQANARHASRYLQAYVDDDGCVIVKGVLSPEQGALFLKALRGAGDALREVEGDSREASGAQDRHGARNADALECLAESFLAGGHAPLPGRERHVVHVHVDEQVLRDAQAVGRCEIEDAPVPPATLQRLCCDASLITVVEDDAGSPRQLSRKTRVVPVVLLRALMIRDGGCRFPGCCNTRFVDAHHIRHWAHGGETTLENLILLCPRHHRFLHEHGYRVVSRQGELCFERPDGRPVIDVPRIAPIDAELALSALVAAQDPLGIDESTADSHWAGEQMDYQWVVRSLLGTEPPCCHSP